MHILLANQGQGSLFENNVNGLIFKTKFENNEIMKKGSNLFSDRAGTGETSFTSNHTTFGESHYKFEATSKFCKEIVDYLTKLENSGDLDSITLICEPSFLGELRKKIPTRLESMIVEELPKNFYTEKPHKLKLFLKDHNIKIKIKNKKYNSMNAFLKNAIKVASRRDV